MKKIFTFLLALGTLSSVFAQSGSRNSQWSSNKNNSYDSRSSNQRNNQGSYSRSSNTTSYNQHQQGGAYSNDRRYTDRQRQVEIDRVNRDYDQRINSYRNNRTISLNERNRRIGMLQTERNDKLKSFGVGAIVGGVLGLILGSSL